MKRILAVTGAVILLGAAPAGARIVVQQGMAGAHLGETWAAVGAHFATKPDANRIIKSEVLGRIRVVRWGHVTISFDGTHRSSRAIAFDTTGTAQRTANGIGVGSTPAQIRAKLPRARCVLRGKGEHHCWIGRFGHPGARVTDFPVNAHGRVGRVTIGIVID